MRFLAIFALFWISGCGVSYVAPQSEIHIEFEAQTDLDAALIATQQELERLGFEVAPASEKRSQSSLDHLPTDISATMARQTRFWRYRAGTKKMQMSGTLTAFETREDTYFGAPNNAHTPRFELRLSDLRPGGFSENGLAAFDDIAGFLNAQGYRSIIVSPPPPANEEEFARVTTINTLARIVWWTVTWSISTALLGGVLMLVLRRAGRTQTTRRVGFVSISVLLATPLPVPMMFVTIFLPNALIIASGLDFYTKLWAYSPMIYTSFLVSAVLSTVAAIVFVKDRTPSADNG